MLLYSDSIELLLIMHVSGIMYISDTQDSYYYRKTIIGSTCHGRYDVYILCII